LGGGPPGFPRDFTCPAVLGVPFRSPSAFRIRDCHSLWSAFPDGSPTQWICHSMWNAPQPQRCKHRWFRLLPVRSPLLRESRLFSFPQGTKMFQFPWCTLHILWIQIWILRHDPQGVSPFGHPRINACLRLPEAFRCSPRPSSAPGTKASAVRPS
jgi:hypothetical protein